MSGEEDSSSSSSSSDDDLDLMVENVAREDAPIIAAEPKPAEPEPAKSSNISNEDLEDAWSEVQKVMPEVESDGGDDERAKTPSVDGSLYSADDAGADADGDAGGGLNEEIAALEAELGVDDADADADEEQAATREREEKMQEDARQKEAERERREQEKAAREAKQRQKVQEAEERKQKREQEKAAREAEKRRKAQEAEERKARKAEEKAIREAERRQKAQEARSRKEQQRRDRAAAILAFEDDAFPPSDEYNDTDAGALQLAATESVAFVPEERKDLLQRFLGEHQEPRRKPKASLGVLQAGGDGNDRDILDLLGPSDDDDEDDDGAAATEDEVWLTDAAKVLEMVQYTTRHTARSDIPFLFPYDAGTQSFVSAEAKDASMQEAMRHAARLIIGAFGLRHRTDQQPDLLLVWRLLVEGRVSSFIPCTLELFRSDPDFYTAITTLIKGADLQVYDGNLTRSLQHLNLPEEKMDRLVFWNGLSRQRRLDMVEHTIEALEQGRVRAVDAQTPLFRLVSYYNPLEAVSVNQLVTLTLVMHEILHGAHGLFTTELPGFTEDETLDLLDFFYVYAETQRPILQDIMKTLRGFSRTGPRRPAKLVFSDVHTRSEGASAPPQLKRNVLSALPIVYFEKFPLIHKAYNDVLATKLTTDQNAADPRAAYVSHKTARPLVHPMLVRPWPKGGGRQGGGGGAVQWPDDGASSADPAPWPAPTQTAVAAVVPYFLALGDMSVYRPRAGRQSKSSVLAQGSTGGDHYYELYVRMCYELDQGDHIVLAPADRLSPLHLVCLDLPYMRRALPAKDILPLLDALKVVHDRMKHVVALRKQDQLVDAMLDQAAAAPVAPVPVADDGAGADPLDLLGVDSDADTLTDRDDDDEEIKESDRLRKRGPEAAYDRTVPQPRPAIVKTENGGGDNDSEATDELTYEEQQRRLQAYGTLIDLTGDDDAGTSGYAGAPFGNLAYWRHQAMPWREMLAQVEALTAVLSKDDDFLERCAVIAEIIGRLQGVVLAASFSRYELCEDTPLLRRQDVRERSVRSILVSDEEQTTAEVQAELDALLIGNSEEEEEDAKSDA